MEMQMLTIKTILIALILATTAFADVNVIPKPNSIKELPGKLKLSWPVKPAQITLKRGGKYEDEGYKLLISKAGVLIESTSASGEFYALQTLKQMVLFSKDGTVPCLEIEDAPRYEWRGLLLDEARHFFGKEKVKQILDQMALYKLNRFHWHLTDTTGWRIEIKKYPKLTTIGAIGNHTDKNAPPAFYTQDDIREIVAYAAERFITIVPEIDMPGHAGAAVRAYPELDGGGSTKNPNFTFNPGSEQTYQFLTDVLKEVTELFPSQWIHYGADEVHFAGKVWATNSDVKELMKKEGLRNIKEVERYFNRRMANVITDLGRTTTAWDEVVYSGLNTDNTLVMWWHHDKMKYLVAAFKNEFDVVLAPRIPCYFDFNQDPSHKAGRRHLCSLDKTYAFPAGLELVESQVKGIQACLWSEKIVTGKRLDFMTYPRLQALSESAWTQADSEKF